MKKLTFLLVLFAMTVSTGLIYAQELITKNEVTTKVQTHSITRSVYTSYYGAKTKGNKETVNNSVSSPASIIGNRNVFHKISTYVTTYWQQTTYGASYSVHNTESYTAWTKQTSTYNYFLAQFAVSDTGDVYDTINFHFLGKTYTSIPYDSNVFKLKLGVMYLDNSNLNPYTIEESAFNAIIDADYYANRTASSDPNFVWDYKFPVTTYFKTATTSIIAFIPYFQPQQAFGDPKILINVVKDKNSGYLSGSPYLEFLGITSGTIPEPLSIFLIGIGMSVLSIHRKLRK